MRKFGIGVWFLFWVAVVVALQAIACGQEVDAPSEVGNGEAIHFQYTGDAGDSVRWLLLNPYPEPVMHSFTSRYGTSYIVDPPIGFSGRVRVQVLVMDVEMRVKFLDVIETTVNKQSAPDPDPDPEPTPPTPPDDYDGINDLGIGKISFDNAPGYDARIVNLFRAAAGHVRGHPSLKVIHTDSPQLNNSDYNVIVWIRGELQRSHPEWADWHNKIFEEVAKQGIRHGTPINTWVDVFMESAAGVEARK